MPLPPVGYSVRCEQPDFSDLPAELTLAEALGVDNVELPIFAMDLIAGGRVMAPALARLKPLLADRPFTFTAHGPIAGNLMDEPERIDRHLAVLRSSLAISAEIGAAHMIMHTGMVVSRDTGLIDSRYAQQREHLAGLGDYAQALGVRLMVENVFTYDAGQHTALPGRLAAELAAVNHPFVQGCFDFSHGLINSTLRGADFMAEARAFAPQCRHLHIHDSFGIPTDLVTYSRGERLAYGLGDLHLPLGWGAVPWDAIMAECRFADGVVFNIELEARYRAEAEATVASTRALAAAYADRALSPAEG